VTHSSDAVHLSIDGSSSSFSLYRYSILSHSACNAGPGSGLVFMSARFLLDCTHATRIVPAAMASRTRWYAMELCFFLRVEAGCVTFVTTEELSQNVFTGPSNGTPNMRSLYHKLSSISTAMRIATNSELKVEVSTVLCFRIPTDG
jgi:hypothetical protein